jgi:hypothetical protein
MKHKEKEIEEIEKEIEKNNNYIKHFQESLYEATRDMSHKVLKTKLVELKNIYLDLKQDAITEKKLKRSSKPNFDSQRAFLENNIAEYKRKIETTQRFFKGDHHKLMRENTDLIIIQNELLREKETLEKQSKSIFNIQSHGNSVKKTTNKDVLPKFGNISTDRLDAQASELKKELYEIEYQIQAALKEKALDKKNNEKKKEREQKYKN